MSIVHDLCGIGSADVIFIDELIEEWDIDSEVIVNQAWSELGYLQEGFNANSIITTIYYLIADKYELLDKDWTCFINCLDSHFCYKGKDIYDRKQLEIELMKEQQQSEIEEGEE